MLAPERVENNERWYDQIGKSLRIYTNALLQNKLILADNKGKSVIYLWRNLINGKIYIGSAVDLRNRMNQYFSLKYLVNNNSMLICCALLKYGPSNFSLEILEYCPISKLLKKEKDYFDLLNPDYNLLK